MYGIMRNSRRLPAQHIRADRKQKESDWRSRYDRNVIAAPLWLIEKYFVTSDTINVTEQKSCQK